MSINSSDKSRRFLYAIESCLPVDGDIVGDKVGHIHDDIVTFLYIHGGAGVLAIHGDHRFCMAKASDGGILDLYYIGHTHLYITQIIGI